MNSVSNYPPEQDYELTVTVRLYGGGTASEAAAALRDYNGTFDLRGDREVEIIDVRPVQREDGTIT